MGTGSRDEASMRRILSYKFLFCDAVVHGDVVGGHPWHRDWHYRAAEREAGFAGKVIASTGIGAAEIDVPEDPSWLLLP